MLLLSIVVRIFAVYTFADAAITLDMSLVHLHKNGK